MCELIIVYILTITTEVNSGHIVYSETFHDKKECEMKAEDYNKHKYIIEAKCSQKTLKEEIKNE